MIIEFVEPDYPSRRAWTAVLAIAALAAVVFAAARVIEARAQSLSARAHESVVVPAAAATHAPPPLPIYAADAQRALDRASLPAAPALAELEAVSVVGIQLNSIDANMGDRTMRVGLQASSDAVLGDYLDQLNAGLDTPVWCIERVSAINSPVAPTAPAKSTSAGGLLVSIVRGL